MFVPSRSVSACWTVSTADLEVLNENIYRQDHNRCEGSGSRPVKQIEREYGIPIVNKRISVTPIAFVGGKACKMSGGLCDALQRRWIVPQKRLASTLSAATPHWYPRA